MWTTTFVMAASVAVVALFVLPGRIPARKTAHHGGHDDHEALYQSDAGAWVAAVIVAVVLGILGSALFAVLASAGGGG
ncbi:hypothetical protein [Nakamurella leprariae]|uniref:Uncharacterized protein n=1 Tax=Nakamurella leprariae TaxID=2803911 RepID=A0A938YIH0_9ACTN|nr:hypothetical protein [Nakamurella leprariae]MBM9468453.1 hypothetical protein [Nakamurella leprariae]